MEVVNIQNRLKRIEGQIRGVENMVSTLRSTDEIINQLKAIRSAVDSLLISVVESEIELADKDRIIELKRTIKSLIGS